MDMTQIDEQWVIVETSRPMKNDILYISNTGKYKKRCGEVGILAKEKFLVREHKAIMCSHIIADNFLVTVKRKDQTFVDHITHNPTDYNVNDVRNLRWCTNMENCNFEEARENYLLKVKRGADNWMYGRTGEKSPMYGRTGDRATRWTGDAVGPMGAYRRAKKEYKRNPTNNSLLKLKEARKILQEFRRQRKIAKKTSSPILCQS